MLYQFQLWDNLLANALHIDSINTLVTKPKDIAAIKAKLSEEYTRLIQAFSDSLLMQASTKQCIVFVQQHQQALTRLLTQLLAYQDKASKASAKALYQMVYQQAVAIWLHFETIYHPYLHQQLDWPIAISQQRLQSLEPCVQQLLKELLTMEEAGGAIVAVLQQYWLAVNQQTHNYKSLKYCQQLIQSLGYWAKKDVHDVPLGKFFLQKNFNSQHYLDYAVQQLNQTVLELTTTTAQLQYLIGQQKALSQSIVERHICADSRLPSVKKYLLQWLKAEIHTQQNLSVIPVANINSSLEPTVLKFNTTVKALAIIGRAAFETKLILNHNKTEAFQWLSGHLATIGSDTVSHKTLYKRGSQPAQKDKELAKDILMQLFDQIRKY